VAVSKADRNERLDALGSAVTAWATARRAYLQKQVSFSKRLLKGRTGSERLNQASIESATTLTVEQINDFLTGE
jgi:hypothetical protein